MDLISLAIIVCGNVLAPQYYDQYIFTQCKVVAKSCLEKSQLWDVPTEFRIEACEEYVSDWLSVDRD